MSFIKIEDFMNKLVPGIGRLETPLNPGSHLELRFKRRTLGSIPVADSGTGIEQLLMLSVVLFAENKDSLILQSEFFIYYFCEIFCSGQKVSKYYDDTYLLN